MTMSQKMTTGRGHILLLYILLWPLSMSGTAAEKNVVPSLENTIPADQFPLLNQLLHAPDDQDKVLIPGDWKIDYENSNLTISSISYRRQMQPENATYWFAILAETGTVLANYQDFNGDQDRLSFSLDVSDVAAIIDNTNAEPGYPTPNIEWKKVKLPLDARLTTIHIQNIEILLRDSRETPPLLLPVKLQSFEVKGLSLLPDGTFTTQNANFSGKGSVLGGELAVEGQISPTQKPRIQKLSLTVKQLPLTSLNLFLMTFAGVDAAKGSVDVAINATAMPDLISGTLSFVTRDAELVDGWDEDQSLWKNVKENLADMGISMLEEGDDIERISADLAFEGPPDNLQLDVWQVIGTLISNAVAESLGKREATTINLPTRETTEKAKPLNQ